MTPANIKKVAEAAGQDVERVLRHFLPGGKVEGREYTALNPTRDDAKPGSFLINLDKGIGKDFATGDGFSDLVAVVAYIRGCSQSKAAEELAEFLALDVSEPKRPDNKQAPAKPKPSRPLMPIPDNVGKPPAKHYKRGKPSAVWCYTDSTGKPLFYVYRFEPSGEGERKQYAPLSWDHAKNKWQWRGAPAPRPLYRLHEIAARRTAPVLVCEGEKAADAAQTLLPQCVATTPPNGAQSPKQADWSPLKGRVVWIWPDFDEPGYAFRNKVAELATSAGAKEVRSFNMSLVSQSPDRGKAGDLPKGWDAADALAQGWTTDALAALLDNSAFLLTPGSREKNRKSGAAATANDGDDFGPRFEVTEKGVYYHGITYDRRTKQYERAPALWVCSPFRVTACTRDVSSENWGRLLEFCDPDKKAHVWAMPMSLLSGSCEGLRGQLLRLGLEISTHPEARRRVEDYIQSQRPDMRARCVSRTGWHEGVFAFPHKTIGHETDERVVFQSDSLDGFGYRERGTLEEWRRHVASLCRGNSRLLFGVSVGFASMLLELADAESGGFHFRGDSSTGKTTILRVASSLFGGPDYLQRWRATDNGLEAVAAQHSDTLLCLDELAQLDPRAAGETAYMLANGSGKVRAGRDGNARERKRWRLLFLSAGEIGLVDHMRQAGKKAKAGQELRMADIPADAGAGLGAWENLNGMKNGAVLSREINEASGRYYGVAAPAFIAAVIENRAALPLEIKTLINQFVSEVLPDDASGQAERVAVRFALVAIGGELATAYGITGWNAGEADQAAKRCFADWLEARGGAGNQEHANMLAQVRGFFEMHGEARFSDLEVAEGSPEKQRTINRAGFVRADQLGNLVYYVLPEVYRKEICEGFDAREVSKLLVNKGWLDTESSGRPAKKVRLPGSSNPRRCYVFRQKNMVE